MINPDERLGAPLTQAFVMLREEINRAATYIEI